MKKIVLLTFVLIFLTSCSIKEKVDNSQFEETSGNYNIFGEKSGRSNKGEF